MNRSVLLLGALVFTLGVTSGYLWLRLHHEQELLEVALTRAAESEGSDLGAVAVADKAALSDTASAATSSGARRAPATIAGSQGSDSHSHAQTKRGEKLPVLLAQQKESLRRTFPDLEAALHLEEREAENLLDLLVEQQLKASRDPPHVPSGELEWDPNNKPEWVLNEEAKQRERDEEIAALIGKEKLQAWEEYRDSAGARMLVRELRSVLDGSTDPIRDDQIPLLTSALTEAQQRYSVESQYYQYGSSSVTDVHGKLSRDIAAINQAIARSERYNEYLHYAASQYLSTEQQEQFSQMLDQRLEVDRAYRDLLRSQTKARSGPRQ